MLSIMQGSQIRAISRKKPSASKTGLTLRKTLKFQHLNDSAFPRMDMYQVCMFPLLVHSRDMSQVKMLWYTSLTYRNKHSIFPHQAKTGKKKIRHESCSLKAAIASVRDSRWSVLKQTQGSKR